MTELLYQTDSYLKAFDAQVTHVDTDNNAVVLDRTAFYPGGGGQPHDVGVLEWDGGEANVVKVKQVGTVPWHTLEGPLPPVGDTVRGTIEWQRRYALMRTHTALHILCGVIWRDHGAQVTGGNMEPFSGRLDFELDHMDRALADEIQGKINFEVGQARDIEVAILDRKSAEQIPDLIRTKINLLPPQLKRIRTVEIKGLDLQADGGTHVVNTREVGNIRIVDYKSKGKINKRIRIALEDESV